MKSGENRPTSHKKKGPFENNWLKHAVKIWHGRWGANPREGHPKSETCSQIMQQCSFKIFTLYFRENIHWFGGHHFFFFLEISHFRIQDLWSIFSEIVTIVGKCVTICHFDGSFKMFGPLILWQPAVLIFTQAHLCDIQFCYISRDNCAIKTKIWRYDRYKYRATWKVSLLGL